MSLFIEANPKIILNKRQKIVQDLEENLKLLPDKLDFKFGDFNELFFGHFNRYYPDIPESQKKKKEEIFEASIFATGSRKQVLSEIFQIMQSDFKNQTEKSQIILDGAQGRGKSYTFLLLSHLLRKTSKIFLVYIQNPCEINANGWEYVCDQFEFSASEEEKKEIKLLKNYIDENTIKNSLNNVLKKYQEKGFLTILMVDQLNFFKGSESFSQIARLLNMSGWDVCLCSQSANNETQNSLTTKFTHVDCPELMNETDTRALLEDYISKNVKDLIFDDKEFDNLIQYTGNVPREVIRLIQSEGGTIDLKIEKYIEQRYKELFLNHVRFRSSAGDMINYGLNISAFYVDTNIPFISKSPPFIDKQITILEIEKENASVYRFRSVFPLCKSVLTESIYKETLIPLNSNFFEDRLTELRKKLQESNLDPEMRGLIYEGFIHATLQNLQKRNILLSIKILNQIAQEKKFIIEEVRSKFYHI